MKSTLRILVAVLGLLTCAPQMGDAQGSGEQRTRSVAEALDRFEQDALASHAVSPVGWNWLLRLVSQTAPADSAVVDSVFDGIERKALSSTNDRVRVRATSFLTAVGNTVTDERSHPILPKLIHIYRASADPVVRVAVIRGSQWQRPQAEAVRFLEEVATSSPGTVNPDFGDEPWEAVTVLAHLGDSGIAELRELRLSGRVQDWKARGYLDYLARRGYTL
jgi:hypothetical protein